MLPWVSLDTQAFMAWRAASGSDRKSTTRTPVPNDRASESRKGWLKRVSFWPHSETGVAIETRPLRTSVCWSPSRVARSCMSELSPDSRSWPGTTCCTSSSWSAVPPAAPAWAMARPRDTA